MKIFTFIFLLIAKTSFAADFVCENYVNNKIISKVNVATEVNVKKFISREELFVSYITEVNDSEFILEYFSPVNQIRVYSEARIEKENAYIAASSWSEKNIINIKCLIK